MDRGTSELDAYSDDEYFSGQIVTENNMSKNKWMGPAGLATFVVAAFVVYHWFSLGSYLTLENLKNHQQELHTYYLEHSLSVTLIYALIYIASTALSLPGATILTLAGGVIFGLGWGLVVVSFSSTIGATLAFLTSRFLLRDFVQHRFQEKLVTINRGFENDGKFYLFTLRLIPLFPFFLVNLVMGLTSIRVLTFFIVSQIGMLPGTFVYVNAGTQLAKIDSLRGIMSPAILGSFALLGLLPLISKWIIGIFKSQKHFDYNMVVIGAGSAGLVSAYIASALKAKVALIEKHKMGGDCLNTGCVPSKAFIRSAKVLSHFKRAKEFGLEALPTSVNFAHVMERVQRVVSEIAPHDSVERYTALGVECIQGAARIRTPFEVEVNGKILKTKNIVIATGASPLVPPIPGLSEISYLTSDTVWNLRELPKRLVVLGGGPIGCELAQSFARFGSQVSLVEMAPRIMAREDEDVSTFIAEKFKNEGVSIYASHKALRIEKDEKTLICEHQGKEVKIQFDEILVALGRKANIKGFGLEELNIEVSKSGTIVADEYMRTTNYPNIFVCGDVTGPYQFTHSASHQAWYVAVNSLFSPFKRFKVDYRVIPWCTFTDPEVARVGLNESEAKEKGIAYQISRYGIEDLDRAIAEEEAHGFVKVLTPPGSDKILGVTIVGGHAGDIIAEYVAAMKHGFGLNKILGTIHIYPTFAEANKYAAGVWKRANAPKKALEILARFHRWRRS
jgi:dihydrolipoamide dehydrogenase